MIVVIGAFSARVVDGAIAARGMAAAIARSAARAGSSVEVVARIGDDPDGDALQLDLAGSGIGHVSVLRDSSRHTAVEGSEADDDAAPGSADADFDAATPTPAVLPTLEAADVGLALRYLTDFGVVALVHPSDAALVATVVEAVSWASAHLVVVVDPVESADATSVSIDDLPPDAVVVEASADAEGPGLIIGRYLAAVDAGTPPVDAFALLRDVGSPQGVSPG